MIRALFALALAGASVCACAPSSSLPPEAGVGPDPTLPPPSHSLIPEVHVAKAGSWAPGATPQAASGLRVNAFASGLDHPRWLYVLPNGDVLVAETDAPPKPAEKGLKATFMKIFMKKAGSGT